MMIPKYTKDAIDRWTDQGIPPGSFVQAVLENDLMGAYARADDTNMAHMKDIVQYVYDYVPALAHGSKEIMIAWQKRLQAKSGTDTVY